MNRWTHPVSGAWFKRRGLSGTIIKKPSVVTTSPYSLSKSESQRFSGTHPYGAPETTPVSRRRDGLRCRHGVRGGEHGGGALGHRDKDDGEHRQSQDSHLARSAEFAEGSLHRLVKLQSVSGTPLGGEKNT